MSSWWKKTRRRAKQKVLEATGASDGVESDPQWDTLWETFNEDIKAIKKLQRRLNNVAPVFSKWSSDLNGEVEEISKYFSASDAPEDLRGSTSALAVGFDKVARGLWPNIEEKFETHVKEPLDQILLAKVPAIKAKAKHRAGIKTDVASYRRKVQKLNDSEKADPERKKVVRQKLNSACSEFEALDAELKQTLRQFHAERFLMVRPMVQNALFYQLDVLCRTGDLVSAAAGKLPVRAREQAIAELAAAHEANGLRPPSEKGWGIKIKGTLGSLTSRFQRKSVDEEGEGYEGGVGAGTNQTVRDEEPVRSPSPEPESAQNPFEQQDSSTFAEDEPAPEPVPATATGDSNPFAAPEEEEPTVDGFLGEMDTTPPAAPADDGEWVIADFDFTSGDAGDLPFQKGDRIKVLGKEGGWWKGEVNGQTGMFPANYTHPE